MKNFFFLNEVKTFFRVVCASSELIGENSMFGNRENSEEKMFSVQLFAAADFVSHEKRVEMN